MKVQHPISYDFTLSFSEVLNRILSCYKLTPFFLIIINFLGMTTSLSNLYWDLKFDRRVENSSYVEVSLYFFHM